MSERWKVLLVKDFSRIATGGTPSTNNAAYWNKGTVPWLLSGEVHKKRIFYADNFISEEGLKNSSAKIIPKKTLLVALAGQGKTRGTVAITEIETTTNQSIGGIITDNKICNPDYLFFNIDNRYEELRSISGGSGRAGLNVNILGNLDVSIPPLPEQKKIASILTAVDEVIEKTQAQIDKLEYLKKATMNELLTKGIGHTEFKDSELGRIPKSWEVKRFGELAFFQRGHDITVSEQIHGHFPVVSSSGITGYHNEGTTQAPNVVVGRKGSIGSVHFIEEEFWTHDTSLYVVDFFDNYQKFIFYLAIWLDLQKYGTKSGSPSLNRNDIHPIKIATPSVSEQREIAAFLDSIETKIQKNVSKTPSNPSAKKSLDAGSADR